MPTALWWGLGILGLLLLIVLIRFGRRALYTRRLTRTVIVYLSIPDMDEALTFIEQHPELLGDDANRYIDMLLDRVTAAGDVELLMFGSAHQMLLQECRQRGVAECRKQGTEVILQRVAHTQEAVTAMEEAVQGPARERLKELLLELVSKGEIKISPEELDEETVEAMSHILNLLSLSADEEAIAAKDQALDEMRRVIRERDQDSSPPPADAAAGVPSPALDRNKIRPQVE